MAAAAVVLKAREVLEETPEQRSYHAAATPYALPNDDSEWKRLDDMHAGLKAYLGNKNTHAPLKNPKDILELGAGSGIWACEMALDFPNAQVVAVDVSPINTKRMPANCKYESVNLTKDWPWAPESFDVIHMRFLLVHLPHWQEIAKKAIATLRPGGFLLLEDIDHHVHSESGPVPPAIVKFHSIYHDHMDPSGVDPDTGVKLWSFLKGSHAFNEVECLSFKAPFTEYTDDPEINHVGQVMRLSFSRAYASMHLRMGESGMTPEIVEGYIKAVHDPAHKLYTDMFFTWARKSAVLVAA